MSSNLIVKKEQELNNGEIHTLNIDPSFVNVDNLGSHFMVENEPCTSVKLEIQEGMTVDNLGSHFMVENEPCTSVKLEIQEGMTENINTLAIEHSDGRIQYIIQDAKVAVTSNESYANNVIIPSTSTPNTTTATVKKYFCSTLNCNKAFASINHLKTHQRIHAGDRPFACCSCDKSFTTTYAVKAHMRIHSGEKPYVCSIDGCLKMFKTSGDLRKHIRTHTGERPFKCEVCNKCFTTSNIRKVHMRVHTGERPYKCQYENCGRSFSSATNYKNHHRIHTGEKPFVCTIENCGRRFTEYSSLYKHHMVHNNQKRFTCNHCGRSYRQMSTLAVHKKTVHSNKEQDESETVVVIKEITVATDLGKDLQGKEIISSIESLGPLDSEGDLHDNPTYLEIYEDRDEALHWIPPVE